jgi:hypothetical protein
MALARGFRSFLGIGEETTYGTSVSRTHWTPVTSIGLNRDVLFKPVPHLGYSGATSTMHRALYQEGEQSGGPISVPMYFDDPALMILMAHSLGACTDAGGPTYTHTMNFAVPTTLAKPSLTLEQANGAADSKVYEGCLLNGGELKLSAGGVLSFSTTVIAETAGALTSQSTPTYATSPELVVHNRHTSLVWNAATIALLDWSVKWDRKLVRRQMVGSHLTSEPTHGEQGTVEVTATIEHGVAANEPDVGHVAGTTGDLVITLTGGTSPNAIAITVHNAQLTKVARSISGAGVIRTTVTWMGLADSSDSGLKVVFTNTKATYNA